MELSPEQAVTPPRPRKAKKPRTRTVWAGYSDGKLHIWKNGYGEWVISIGNVRSAVKYEDARRIQITELPTPPRKSDA